MKIINYTNPRLLIAEEVKMLKSKNDNYIAEEKDENGNVIKEEHKPYLTNLIFLGEQITTLEEAQEIYEEVEE